MPDGLAEPKRDIFLDLCAVAISRNIHSKRNSGMQLQRLRGSVKYDAGFGAGMHFGTCRSLPPQAASFMLNCRLRRLVELG